MNKLTSSTRKYQDSAEEIGTAHYKLRFSSLASYEIPAVASEEVLFFPYIDAAITVRDARTVKAIDQATRERGILAFIPCRAEKLIDKSGEPLALLMTVSRCVPLKNGARQVLLSGLWRIIIKDVMQTEPYIRVRFSGVNEPDKMGLDGAELMKAVLTQIEEFVRTIPDVPAEIVTLLKNAESPGKLADLCAYTPSFKYEEKLEIFNTLDPLNRLRKVQGILERQLTVLRKAAMEKSIPECETCQDLADKAFDAPLQHQPKIALAFLNHVIAQHTSELLLLLAEKYAPIFTDKRALR